MGKFKSFISNLFRRRSSVGQAAKSNTNEPSIKESREEASKAARFIVMHSLRAKKKRKRKHKNQFSKNLSYVSSVILEDYGQILSRRDRRLLTKQGIPFRPIYN